MINKWADTARVSTIKNQQRIVENAIESAVQKGQFFVYIYLPFVPEIKDWVEELGYKFEIFNDNCWRVSWK